MKRGIWIISIFLFFIIFPLGVKAQTPSGPTSEIEKLIEQFKTKIADLEGQENTLSKKISILDSEIALTKLQIYQTKKKIDTLSSEINQLIGEIDRLEDELTKRTILVLHRIPASYKRQVTPQFAMLFLSNDFSHFISDLKYLTLLEKRDTEVLVQLKAAQNNFNERKNLREQKKTQLVQLQKNLQKENFDLAQQKNEKQSLLDQTKNSEATYQQLLTQAQAQLASFASFADLRGATLLDNQTFCDSWGCYYNQRDRQWGALLINNRNDCKGPCNIARVGCLVASLSMVASYLGHTDIMPSDIALSSPSNFAVDTASLVQGTINVKGFNITRTPVNNSLSPSMAWPAIVGIKYGSFGTHFVVIKSYTHGVYVMNDPYTDGGHDKNFTDYYSLGSVFEVDRVTM